MAGTGFAIDMLRGNIFDRQPPDAPVDLAKKKVE
jgi:hypothetical protein